MPFDSSVSVDELAERTRGFTGAEITGLCQNAAFLALQQSLDSQTISQSHFDSALSSFRRQLTDDMLNFYDNFSRQALVQ